jgi:hypothetical protein
MTVMRGLLKFLAIVAIIGALYYARWYMSYWQVERNSSFFVTDAINKIGDSWNTVDFIKLADGDLKSQKTIETAFKSYSKLGPIVRPAHCELKDFSSYKYQGSVSANYIAATYECQAVFKNGPATIQLIIERFQDTAVWKIWDFHVFSPFFTTTK